MDRAAEIDRDSPMDRDCSRRVYSCSRVAVVCSADATSLSCYQLLASGYMDMIMIVMVQ